MKQWRMKPTLGLVAVMVLVAAMTVCFSYALPQDSAEKRFRDVPETGMPIDWKPESSLAGGLQRFSSYDELKAFLRTIPPYPLYWYINSPRGLFALEGTSAFDSKNGKVDFSKTNIQVEGVDEADIVKSDGEYLYMAIGNKLVIARVYPPEDARILSRVELKGNIEGMFINGNRLAVLVGDEPVYGIWREPAMPYDGSSGGVSIKVYDVTSRDNPIEMREVAIDGCYVSSRMLGEHVYLIATGSAYLPGRQGNVVLPTICVDDTVIKVDATEIWHAAAPDTDYRFTTIISVNMVDDTEEPEHETLLVGAASIVYMSACNLYVTFTDWSDISEKTSIHRIHIGQGQIEYHATGEVPGTVLNQFSMDEQEAYFRIATTTGNVWGGNTRSANNLYVLDQNLDIISRLEGLAPGEQIYSARFMSNRCYLVTFKKIDPLFVIDLEDPYKPKILGELKITGYSDYLHPYDENHVIGIGKEAIAAEEGDFAWYQGIKISLFDVSDVANPKEIGKYEIGDRGTDSPVLYDHRAFLFDKSRNLLVMPVLVCEIDRSKYGQDLPPYAYGEPVWQGACVFNISPETGIEFKCGITHCNSSTFGAGHYYFYSSSCFVTRSLYIGEVLYTISNDAVKMNDMKTLKSIGALSLG